MLEAKHSGRSPHTNPNYQTLIAFKPRQVLLAERSSKATTTTMKQCGGSSKTLTINHDQKALLLQSVLGYLERNGFSRALKRLLSEAQIETDNWKTCSLRLEDMYGSYSETCTRAETEFDTLKDQEVLNNGISKKSGDSNSSAIEQTVGKKKKKKSDEGDNNAAENQPENGIAESAKNSRVISAKESLTISTVELKESEKSTKTADTVSELQMDESTKKQKDKKKKKSKSISESLDGNVEQVSLDSLPAVNKEICDNLKPSLGDGIIDSQSEVKSKDKKKKHKPSTNSLGDDVEHGGLVDIKGLITDKLDGNVEQKQSDSLLVATEDKSIDNVKFDSKAEGKSKDKKKKKKQQQSTDSPFENMHDVPLDEKKVESKEKKRKKEGSASNTLSGVVPSKEDPIECESKNGSLLTPEDAVDREKKSSKKMKRLASETNEVHHVEKLESEESKRRKTETLEDGKTFEWLAEANAKTGDDKHSGKESERGNGAVSPNELQNTSIKQPEVPTNGNLEKDGDKSAAQKTRRKQHEGSAEPKSVNAFQRVKIDEVKFADERLQDNSYWAKGGAEIGYGAKAQEILGQVRGRDFRHEKTKKKRGSYRGGLIDLEAHSVKFNYSDED